VDDNPLSFLLKWLRPETSAKVGLRPHRNVTIALDYDAAYSRVMAVIDQTLGANITIDDRRGGLIEAGFGLINSERVRVNLERQGDATTLARIEAFYAAGAVVPDKSAAVEVLANALEAGIAP
jgi:hypothetical protein